MSNELWTLAEASLKNSLKSYWKVHASIQVDITKETDSQIEQTSGGEGREEVVI